MWSATHNERQLTYGFSRAVWEGPGSPGESAGLDDDSYSIEYLMFAESKQRTLHIERDVAESLSRLGADAHL